MCLPSSPGNRRYSGARRTWPAAARSPGSAAAAAARPAAAAAAASPRTAPDRTRCVTPHRQTYSRGQTARRRSYHRQTTHTTEPRMAGTKTVKTSSNTNQSFLDTIGTMNCTRTELHASSKQSATLRSLVNDPSLKQCRLTASALAASHRELSGWDVGEQGEGAVLQLHREQALLAAAVHHAAAVRAVLVRRRNDVALPWHADGRCTWPATRLTTAYGGRHGDQMGGGKQLTSPVYDLLNVIRARTEGWGWSDPGLPIRS